MLVEQMDIQDVELHAVLLPRLRDRVFHVTSQDNFEKIRQSGAILHNRDGRFPLNKASENSFGRARGFVCFFDLRQRDDQTLEETLRKYFFLEPASFKQYELDFTISRIAYMFLASRAENELISYEFAKRECPRGHYIPQTEAWFPADVPLSQIDSALLVTIRTAAPSHPILYAHHRIAYEEQKKNPLPEK